LDDRGELVVGRARTQRRTQVVLLEREQAVAELALGREPHAVARAAERLRDTGDDTDLAAAVAVAEPGGRGARALDGLEREHRADPLDDLFERHDGVVAPRLVRVERHELDEAHDDAALT